MFLLIFFCDIFFLRDWWVNGNMGMNKKGTPSGGVFYSFLFVRENKSKRKAFLNFTDCKDVSAFFSSPWDRQTFSLFSVPFFFLSLFFFF